MQIHTDPVDTTVFLCYNRVVISLLTVRNYGRIPQKERAPMDDKEKKRSVPDTDGQKSAPRETLSMDSIEAPVNVLHGKIAQGADMPFVARSTGKYHEGRGFSYYREGFDAYCFFMTVSGAGEITYRGETKRVERGDMVFVSSALPALTRSLNDDWRFCFVNIAGEFCGYFESVWNQGGFTVIRPRDPGHYTELLDRITKELGDPSPLGELTVNLLITRLLTEAMEEYYGGEPSPKQYPAWVREATTVLSERCAEELRVSELAARFYMEQSSFTRRFKSHTGKTPKEYQINCRMERAVTLLLGSDLSLSEIAVRCGFASHSFFTKTFKRLYGITPTAYRLGLPKK
jgi:AraC-like DNA-binding protein